MGDKSRLAPEDLFPADLAPLDDSQVEILNSKVHRQLDLEYVEDQEPNPETEFRHEELSAELDYRDAAEQDSPPDGRDAQQVLLQEPKDKTPA